MKLKVKYTGKAKGKSNIVCIPKHPKACTDALKKRQESRANALAKLAKSKPIMDEYDAYLVMLAQGKVPKTPKRRVVIMDEDDAIFLMLMALTPPSSHDPFDNSIGGPNDYAYGM